jgi:hypothetical protein
MVTFNIVDIHKISDRGHVLSGNILDNGVVSPGDKIVFKNNFDNYIFKITAVTNALDKKLFGILINSNDFEKIHDWNIIGQDTKVVNLADRKKSSNAPIIWTGDLSDDCTAEWAGLLLRAECMDEDYWWWEVSDIENPEIEIDSSNNYDISFIGGDASRQKAEEVAKMYLGVN